MNNMNRRNKLYKSKYIRMFKNNVNCDKYEEYE